MKRLIVRPEAEADITKAAIWYESREPELGLELLADIQRSISLALHNPRAFLCVRKSPEVRRILVKKFPRIFYTRTRFANCVCGASRSAPRESAETGLRRD